MTEFDLLLDDPAEETQDASAQPQQAEPIDTATPVTPVFTAPVLDRIRASY